MVQEEQKVRTRSHSEESKVTNGQRAEGPILSHVMGIGMMAENSVNGLIGSIPRLTSPGDQGVSRSASTISIVCDCVLKAVSFIIQHNLQIRPTVASNL